MWGVQSGFALGELCDVVYTPAADAPARPKAAAAREEAAARPPVVRRLQIDRHLEHEARGLLNAIGLLDRCLASVVATDFEREEWTREIREARHRLDALYAEGLDRNFHIEQ
jgi:hypothetical protein